MTLKTRIPPPLYALACGLIMVWLNGHWPLLRLIPDDWRIAALALALPGLTLDFWALARFLAAHTTITPLHPERASHLVTHGPYRWTRNPMYLGLTCLLSALAWWLGSLSPWALVPAFVVLVTREQILPEEAALTRAFGQTYLDYCRQTPRWLL